ncbi:MAG: flagellar M-ring protein FliF [Bryobacterales bacterium]|jgi:flagellar M-ring protein FliF|nr:flagellar M-ring protein FliF [Bryobacterales bacterium]
MNQLLQLWSGLSAKQRASIVLVAAALVAGIYALVQWQKERDFEPLFEQLAAEEAGQIVARLKESGVEVRLADGGTRVLVPSAEVAQQRLSLAAEGLPKTGRIGFEIFDKTNFGATDFTEQVNYQRAVEGELERSLLTIQQIELARVHITFAKNSVFLENQQPAKGSVMVRLKQGATLEPRQVAAVTHLVASAVEGLLPEQVSIVDMRGNLLTRPRGQRTADGVEAPDDLLQVRKRMEQDLYSKLAETLDPLLGEGRYRASVAAELDMTSGDESAELFDPDQSVMTSTQKQEDVSSSARSGGVPGTASNLPRGAAASRTTGGGVVRRSETVAFQTSRTVRHRKLPQGMLKRVSVSILLDHRLRWEGTGAEANRILEPPDEQTINSIRELVTGAIGLSEERGDQLVVESLPFEHTLNAPPPEAPTTAAPVEAPGFQLPAFLSFLPRDLPPWALPAAAGAVLLVLLLLGALVWRMRRKKHRMRMQAQPELPPGANAALPDGADPIQIPTAPEDGEDIESFVQRQQDMLRKRESAAIASLKQTKLARTQTEVLTHHLIDTVAEDPNGAAQVLRSWLTEDRQ